MSDSVHISSISSEALKAGLSDVPAWATQKTAEDIDSSLKQMLGMQTAVFSRIAGASSSGSSDDVMGQILKDADKELDNNKQQQKYWKEREPAQAKNISGLKGVATTSAATAFVFSALADAGTHALQLFKQSITVFDKMSMSGVNVVAGFDDVSNGFKSLQHLTVLTGVRFSELEGAIIKYSTAINSAGMGVFAKTIGMSREGMAEFGFSAKESAELLGAMMTSQQSTGDISRRTAEENSKDLKKFGKTIFELSMATGLTNSAIMANYAALAASTTANVYAGQVSKSTAESTTAWLASFKNQNLAKQVLQLISAPVTALSDSFRNLTNVGMGGFAMRLTQFSKSTEGMSPEQRAQALKDFVSANRAELEQRKQHVTLLAQAGVEGAQASLDLITGLTQQADSIAPMSAKQREAMIATNKATTDFANQLERFKSQFAGFASLAIPTLNMFTSVLSGINTSIEFVRDLIPESARDLVANLVAVGTVVATAFGSVFGILLPAAKLMGGAISMAGNALAWLINPVTKLIAGVTLAWSAGTYIGTKIYDFISKFSSVNGILDMIFSGLDHVLQYIPGSLGAGARERVSAANKEVNTPKPTMIDSPSASKTVTASAGTEISTPTTSASSTTVVTQASSEEHTAILSQILQVLSKTTSVHEDTLKAIRNA